MVESSCDEIPKSEIFTCASVRGRAGRCKKGCYGRAGEGACGLRCHVAHLAALVEEHVGGLEIAVDLVVLPVQVVQPVEYLRRYLRQLALVGHARRVRSDERGDRAAIHELEDHVDLRLLVEGVEEGDEPRRRVRAHDAQLGHHLIAPRLLQNLYRLHRHEHAGRRVLGEADGAGRAGAELLEEGQLIQRAHVHALRRLLDVLGDRRARHARAS